MGLLGVLADLVTNNEELQKIAQKENAVEKLADILHRDTLPAKQLEGVLLALAELCSRLEESRRQLLDSQVCLSSLSSSTWIVTIKNCIIRFSFLQVGEEIHREQ